MGLNYQTNEQIRADKVILIDAEGNKKGVVAKYAALNEARENSLDLIMVGEGDNGIPICKLADYGKMKYKHDKKQKSQHIHKQVTKEMRVNYNIDSHDLRTKHNKILDFLSKHNKVLYIMELKGRERQSLEDAKAKMEANLQEFNDIAMWKEPIISHVKNTIKIATTLSPK